MFEIVFRAFFYLMVGEVVIFVFLNLPFPKAWKAGIFRMVSESNYIKTFLKVQLLLCILAGVFYYDMAKQERHYITQKNKLKDKTTYGACTRMIM